MKPTPLPRRVLFLNDVSFQYGAGVAQARQAEALLSLGIEAGVIAWAPHRLELEVVGTRPVDPNVWLGIRDVDHLEGGQELSDEAVIAGLMAEVARFNPDVVLVGNLHAARWPFQLLPALVRIGCRVITFLHDAYLYTGRCAYPGTCRLYLTGCNETCPTAGQYPILAPELIAPAWRLRREIFGGPAGIDVVANSHWSKMMFRTALPTAHGVDTVELGADEQVFQPGNQAAARAHFKLPTDKPIVLCAAVNFQEERKGCHYLREIMAALKDTVNFAAFGHNTQEIPGLIGLGYHLDARAMALIYQAADLFLGTATEEAFGQTIMEAQLCGLPVVAFQTGGVPEIVRNELTGRLVPTGDSAAAIAAIRALLADADFRRDAAARARHCAAKRFSLPAHAERWRRYFTGWREAPVGANPATLGYPLNEKGDASLAHRPSWPAGNPFLSPEHEGIATATAALERWAHDGDACKLYEAGYHAGDVILEIGLRGARAATVALRGALAHPARTLDPQYIGVTTDVARIAGARKVLAAQDLDEHAHLFHGDLRTFIARWDVNPTLVVLDGRTEPAGFAADLAHLTDWLRDGTTVLVLNASPRDGDGTPAPLRKLLMEWEGADHARFMGCFGDASLYVTTKTSAPRA